jgi:hypothetical protein
MSAYDNDPRVRRRSDGSLEVVVRPGSPMGRVDAAILENGTVGFDAWIAGEEPDGAGFATEDEAIHSLIEDPR